MSKLVIATFPERARVFAGERLLVTTAIANDGDREEQVEGASDPSPHEYRLLPEGDEARALVVSAARLAGQLTPDPTPPLVPSRSMSLAPGAVADRKDELAHMVAGALAPGRYDIFAHYRGPGGETAVSPRASIDVAAPRFEAFSSQFCDLRATLTTVAAAVDDDGAVTLVQRESLGDEPRHGAFHRRHRFERPKPPAEGSYPRHVMATIDTAEIRGGRWLAWIEGRSLGALRCSGDRVLATAAPVPVGLARPRPASPGFQLADGSGLFLITGEHDRQAWVRAVQVTAAGLTMIGEATLGGSPIGAVRAAIRPQGEGAWITLVWAEAARGTLLRTRAYDARLHPLHDQAETLIESDETLLAWELAPLLPSSGPGLTLLSGPDADGLIVHRSFALDGSPPAILRFAPAPLDVEAWAVGAGGIVVVHGEGRLLWCVPGAPEGWQTLAEGVPAVRHLRVFHAGVHGLAAEWVDPGAGHQIRFLHRA